MNSKAGHPNNELSISVLAHERLARLELTGTSAAWPNFRRVCEEHSDQVVRVGSTALTMPLWAFLGCQEELSFVARRFEVTLSPDVYAAGMLQRSARVSQAYAAAKNARPIPHETLSEALKRAAFTRELTAEQSRNVGKLARMPAGATFSVPGAGKTTEALAYYAVNRAADTKLLVICPKNAFAAWEEQLQLCMPHELPFVRLRGGQDNVGRILATNPQKMLITYQQLPNVTGDLGQYLLQSPSMIFLDESHKIKRGFDGTIGNSVLLISDIPQNKLILSGTPMPNDISDLVPQMTFLYPELSPDDDTVADLIRPIYVRTTKDELHLPPIKRRRIPVMLKPAQHGLYELLRSEAARLVTRGISLRDRMQLRRAGQSALRLLQAASNPALLGKIEFEDQALLSAALDEGDSPKLEWACLRARQLAHSGRKCIIWSSFVDNVELIATRLVDLGADFIHGGVDAGSEEEEGTRERKIKDFHYDQSKMVLVANPAACGEGISLHTVCHNAIYVDRNYNAAQYLQSEDRIHRLGLPKTETTYVDILFAPNTVDESVHRRLSVKIEQMAQVLQDPGLSPEPRLVDVDGDGFDDEDLLDFFAHVRA